jgi:hypothetical protein
MNIRLQFNELHEIRLSRGLVHKHDIEVEKIPRRTSVRNEGWNRFSTQNSFTGGEIICFP